MYHPALDFFDTLNIGPLEVVENPCSMQKQVTCFIKLPSLAVPSRLS